MTLDQWARDWAIPPAALADLRQRMGARASPAGLAAGPSESGVQAQVRLEASRLGWPLWRNNVGALIDHSTGRPVRFGLANDSAAVNANIKSADLIGIRPVVITRSHIGSTLGQFVSREVKRSGWRYSGTPREQAQLRWAELVISLGGDAAICTGEGSL